MACEHREEEAVTHWGKSCQTHNHPLFYHTPRLVGQEKLRDTFRKVFLDFKRAFAKESHYSLVNTILSY